MKRTTSTLACSILFLLAPAVAHAGEPGFVPLFDGKTLRGWTIKCKSADKALAKKFCTVDQGTILLDSTGSKKHEYVLLATKKEYDDFVLRLRFQTYRDVKGNSGIQIRSRYDEKDNYCDGPQVDVHPPGPWRTGMIWDETRDARGWLYPDVPKGQWVDPSMAPSDLAFYYADDEPAWNTLEIQAVGPRVTALLNGAVVTDYDGTGVLDDATHTARRVGMKGHIALQIHSNDQLKIRFRNIVIRSPAE